MERVSNVEILDLVNEKRTLIKTICQRQLKFIGYIMREDAIEKLCVQGLIEGKRSRGKQRTVFLQSLALTVGLGVEEWCRLAKDRDSFRDMVVNVRLIQHNNKKIINSFTSFSHSTERRSNFNKSCSNSADRTLTNPLRNAFLRCVHTGVGPRTSGDCI